MKKRIPLILSTALISALLAGCAHNCVTIPSDANSGANVGQAFGGNVGISMASAKLTGNLIESKVQFTNKTSKVQHFQYKFTWLDESGFNQGENTPWTPVTLYPHISRVVSQVAPTQSATKFNLLVCQK